MVKRFNSKNRKRGFTLIELLVVITILAVVLLIAVPLTLSTLVGSKDKLYKTQVNLIVAAAKVYVTENPKEVSSLKKTDDYITLYLGPHLQDGGYAPREITNPKTNALFSRNFEIRVILDETGSYVYNTIDPDEINIPLIVVYPNVQVIKPGESFNEYFNVKVYDKDNKPIEFNEIQIKFYNESSIEIKKEDIDLNVIQDITIKYNFTDETGAKAAEKTRIIKVRNPGTPEIVLKGPNPIEFERNSLFYDPGAIAYSSLGDDISDKIIVKSNVNINKNGTYLLTYSVTDPENFKAIYKTRIVIVKDPEIPVIELNQGNVQLEVMDTYIEHGATAKDKKDGDITDKIEIKYYNNNNELIDVSNITKMSGMYKAKYTVVDSDNNKAEVTRLIMVRPVITAKPIIYHLANTVFIAPTATVRYSEFGYDTVYGKNEGTNTNAHGDTFKIIYNYTYNSVRAKEKYTQVNILDSLKPSIVLSDGGDTDVMTPYVEPGYDAFDFVDGDITSSVTYKFYNSSLAEITKEDMVKHVGVYTIKYSVTNSMGHSREVTRTINVRPVITAVDTIYHEVKTTFVAPSTQARYSEDGYETISPSSNVNVNLIGTYKLTYNYSYGGISAIPKVTNVYVRDTTKPVITPLYATLNIKTTQTIDLKSLVTVTDNYYSNIKDYLNVASSPTFTPNVEGTYTIYYNVTDPSGNVADQVIITIISKKPSIPDILIPLGPCSCFGY